MAFLSYYRKVEETAERLEYVYGFDPDELDRPLCLDKSTHRLVWGEGKPPPSLVATAAGILRGQRKTGEWPERGYVAS